MPTVKRKALRSDESRLPPSNNVGWMKTWPVKLTKLRVKTGAAAVAIAIAVLKPIAGLGAVGRHRRAHEGCGLGRDAGYGLATYASRRWRGLLADDLRPILGTRAAERVHQRPGLGAGLH